MGKVVRSGGRGTSRRVTEKQADNWSGAAYREYQAKKKASAGDRYISMGRGTRRVKFSDIAETSGRSEGKGMWLSSGRGTKRRRVK